MSSLSAHQPPFEKWSVFGAASLAFFFVNFATFASLGVVLFTMVRDLNWSMTAAGFSFSLLGLSCGLSSPMPAITMKWVGGRGTIAIGAVLLMAGFSLASLAHSLIVFDIAIVLVGCGFTMVGNIPGVFLIAAWFERTSARMIGIYLMVGALGASLAPPAVEAIVRTVGWRGDWRAMAVVSALIGVICLALIRDRASTQAAVLPVSGPPVNAIVDNATAAVAWSPRQAVLTPQFMVITAALVMTMTAVTTIHSIIVTHLVKLGATPSSAAFALGALGLTGTLVKGFSGRLCETYPPARFVTVGLALQGCGCLAFVFADNSVVEFGAAIIFGIGWAFALVAGWVLLLDFFGGGTGAKILAIVQLVTTAGAAGPIGAGLIADRYGTFAPIFLLYAGILFLIAVPIMTLRRPLAPAESLTVGAFDNDAARITNAETA
jgi:MFS family permease